MRFSGWHLNGITAGRGLIELRQKRDRQFWAVLLVLLGMQLTLSWIGRADESSLARISETILAGFVIFMGPMAAFAERRIIVQRRSIKLIILGSLSMLVAIAELVTLTVIESDEGRAHWRAGVGLLIAALILGAMNRGWRHSANTNRMTSVGVRQEQGQDPKRHAILWMATITATFFLANKALTITDITKALPIVSAGALILAGLRLKRVRAVWAQGAYFACIALAASQLCQLWPGTGWSDLLGQAYVALAIVYAISGSLSIKEIRKARAQRTPDYLQIQNQVLHALLNSINEPLILIKPDGRISAANLAATAYFSRIRSVGVGPQTPPRTSSSAPTTPRVGEQIKNDDDALPWRALDQGLALRLHSVSTPGGVWSILRLTERNDDNGRLKVQPLLDLLDHCSDAVALSADGQKITYLNPSARTLLGVSKFDECRHYDLQRFFPDQKNDISNVDDIGNGAYCPIRTTTTGQAILRDMRGRKSSIFRTNFKYRHGKGKTEIAATLVHASPNKRVRRRLTHVETHDAVTGLLNRTALAEDFRHWVSQEESRLEKMSLLLLDLHGIGKVNDVLGHSAGDRLLLNLAQTVHTALRSNDLVYRFGGCNFVICLVGCDNGVVRTICERIITSVRAPHRIRGQEIHIDAFIGVAIYPNDGSDLEELLSAADVALHVARKNGRGGHEFFSISMGQRSTIQFSLETGLRRALKNNELQIHFQPQVSAINGCMVGAEALIRWHDPKHGLIQPDQFVALAEESGLIVPIGAWILRSTCEQMRTWRQAGLSGYRIAVNLAAEQLYGSDIVTLVDNVLRTTGTPASQLELEITESTLMQDAERVSEKLSQLRNMGVRIAVDDFGTGYSSLAFLKSFQVNRLKIDRSFVKELPSDSDSCAIVIAIIGLAHNLGLDVVAEGVESIEQMEFLARSGCDSLQGFLFSKPIPSEAMTSFMNKTNGRAISIPTSIPPTPDKMITTS